MKVVRGRKKAVSKKGVVSWSQRVREAIETFPPSALIDIQRKDVIAVLKRKSPNLECTNSQKTAITSLLASYRKAQSRKSKVSVRKVTRRHHSWSNNEDWEIALKILGKFDNNCSVAVEKLKETTKFLSKFQKIQSKFKVGRSAS